MLPRSALLEIEKRAIDDRLATGAEYAGHWLDQTELQYFLGGCYATGGDERAHGDSYQKLSLWHLLVSFRVGARFGPSRTTRFNIVRDVAGPDEPDSGFVEAAFDKLSCEIRCLPCGDKHKKRIGCAIPRPLQEGGEIGIRQRHFDRFDDRPSGVREGCGENA
jgi:hypothetical protein